MVSTERGPTVRSGTSTNSITPIGVTATSTGLPPQTVTTSFALNKAGVSDGHDLKSLQSALRVDGRNTYGPTGSAYIVSYFRFGITTGSQGNYISTPRPTAILTKGGGGNTLPVPPPSSKTYYKMTGFYVSGSVYESFVVPDTPTSPTTVNPNTGHTLINTFVDQAWQV